MYAPSRISHYMKQKLIGEPTIIAGEFNILSNSEYKKQKISKVIEDTINQLELVDSNKIICILFKCIYSILGRLFLNYKTNLKKFKRLKFCQLCSLTIMELS